LLQGTISTNPVQQDVGCIINNFKNMKIEKNAHF